MYYTVCANNNYSICCVIIEYLAYGEIMFLFYLLLLQMEKEWMTAQIRLREREK